MQPNPTVSARITRPLRELMSEYLKNDAHISEGDFIRDAIREKIKRDTPELYQMMFKNRGNRPQASEARSAQNHAKSGQAQGGSKE